MGVSQGWSTESNGTKTTLTVLVVVAVAVPRAAEQSLNSSLDMSSELKYFLFFKYDLSK